MICIVITIIAAITKFSYCQHFVLFKNDYKPNITPLQITIKKTVTQCLTVCSYKVLSYTVSIEETVEKKFECSLYETLDFNTTTWDSKPKTKVFLKLLGSCLAYRIHGFTKSGFYNVLPDPEKKPFEVLCDMVKEGGGWAVLLRRESNQLSFEKHWDEYKNGFGKLDKSFRLGNDKIHEVTNSEVNELKVDLINSDNDSLTARYNDFHVSNESTNYTMEYGDYDQHLSTANDCFNVATSAMFSTYDRDNDLQPDSCSQSNGRGGWWFVSCHDGYMTGRFMEIFPEGNTWCSDMIVNYSELKAREKLQLLSYQKPTEGKEVFISSNGNTYKSSFGNDGSLSTEYHSVYNGSPAWWQVDLQQVAVLISFQYYPRQSSQFDKSVDVFVLTKTLATSDFQTCTSITADDFVGVTATKPYVLSCMTHTKAQFIRLQKHDSPARQVLVFRELKVYGLFVE